MTSPMDAETLRLQALLEARTQALAGRGRDATEAARTEAFLVCTCGTDRYGLPLGAVAQVRPARACTPVPGAPPALLGIVALAGRIVSVLDLAQALGRPAQNLALGRPDSAGPEAGHLVVLRGGTVPVALAVDRVAAVLDVAVPAAEAPAPGMDGTGLGEAAVSGYAAARTLSAQAVPGQVVPGQVVPGQVVPGEVGFVIVDLPRLLRRYCP